MQRIPLNDIELALHEAGTGRPVLLVHGFPLNHHMWDAQVAALSASHRVLAPDLRGFGQSDVTEGTVTMDQMADDLAALLDAQKITEPVVLCGLSMGGYVALAFWRKYAARLSGLILCDTRSAPDSPEAAAGRETTAQNVLASGPQPVVDVMRNKLYAPATLQDKPQLVAEVEAMMQTTAPAGIAAALRGMAVRPDSTPSLPQIAVPTLVLVGEHDAISPPAEMRGIAEAIPGAEFVEIAGAGHMAPMEDPAAVNQALLSFLGGIESGS